MRPRVALCEERMSGDEGHILANGFVEQAHAIDTCGQRHPQEQAALRMRPFHFRREEVIQCRKHRVPALLVALPDGLHVLIEESILGHFIHDHLSKRAGVQVSTLFELYEARDHVGRRHDPSQPQTGCQHFGKGAQVYDVAQVVSVVLHHVHAVQHD